MPGVAPTPVNYSPIVDELVTQWYLTKTFENTIRKRVLMDYLAKNGKLQQADGGGGKYVEIKARVGEFAPAYRAEMAVRTWSRVNLDVSYTAPHTYYETKGVLSEEDLAYLRTQQAIVKLGDKMLTRMSTDMGKGLNGQLIKSNATANTIAGVVAATTNPIPIYGLISCFGYGATAIGYNPDTQASTISAVTAADREVLPNVSYCGISTHPTNGITGVDNKLNESTSPVIANWSSTGFTSASTTYTTNCLDVASHIISRLGMRGDNTEESFPDIGLQTQLMHNQFRNKLRSSTSQQIVFGDRPISPDVGLCPRLFVPFEGINIFPDADVPANCLFILNTREMMFEMVPQRPAGNATGEIGGEAMPIFKVAQFSDIDTGTHKVVAKLMGNLVCNPRFQGMAYNAA